MPADATDTVSVEAFAEVAGSKFSLGSADATVNVTKTRPHTRVIYGSGNAEGWQEVSGGWISGGAWFGPATGTKEEQDAGLAGAIGYYAARFAGMIVEVTVTFENE